MKKYPLIFALVAFCFGLSGVVQPALTAECADSMGCLVVRDACHLPDTHSCHLCPCSETGLQPATYIIAPSTHHAMVRNIKLFRNAGHALVLNNYSQWALFEKRPGPFPISLDSGRHIQPSMQVPTLRC